MIAQVATSHSLIRDYISLTKPRVISLLLVTALGGMFLAENGAPSLSLILLVMCGGALGAGGANAINQFMEYDIDRRMTRTRTRPVATGRIQPLQALTFGISLNIVSFFVLSVYVNPLSALLTLSATLFYLFVYTKGLKRATPQNIVIGGAAGAIPPVVGWTAITGSLDIPALFLFAIIFVWTPPHFWALSLLLKEDYAKADVPMLPVVSGINQTKNTIFIYTIVVVALTLAFAITKTVGWVYLSSSIILGGFFVYYAWRLKQLNGIKGARALFHYSMLYLALLFLSMMVDILF